MSDVESSGRASLPGIQQAADRIHFGRIIRIALLTLLTFAVAIFWTYRMVRSRKPDLRGPGSVAGARALGRPEIGIVDQVPFETDRRLERTREQARVRLESWGWVDRRRRIIHVPIEVAMEGVLRGKRPARIPEAGR